MYLYREIILGIYMNMHKYVSLNVLHSWSRRKTRCLQISKL